MDTIYTVGGGVVLEQVFNAIATMFSGSEFAQIAKVTATLGLLWIIVTNSIFPDWSKSAQWFMIMVLSWNVMIIPKVSVNIRDQLEPAIPRRVDNVPFVLGKFASLTSSIGQSMTDLFNMDFVLPEDITYNKTGFLMGAELMDYMGRITITDPTLRNNVESFMVRCVQRDIQLGKYSFKEILGTNNIFNLLKSKGLSNLRSVTFAEDAPNGGYNFQLYTCQDAFNKIEQEFNQVEQARTMNKIAGYITSFNSFAIRNSSTAQQSASAAVASLLPANYEYFLNQSQGAVDIIYHHLLLNSYYSGISADAGLNYEEVKAQLQTEHTYQSVAKITRQTLPFIRIFFEVIIYALFPVMVLLLLLPGAPMIFYNYVQGLIWLQLWGPVYAVIHFLTTLLQKAKLSGVIEGEGYSGYNISGIHDAIAMISSIAGYMTSLVPVIAWFLLKSFQGIIHNAASMMQPAMTAASGAAAEMTTGNIALGGMSFRNISHDTYGSWSANSGLSLSSADHIQRGDMTVERFGQDGVSRTIDQSQEMSQLDFKPTNSYSLSQQFSTAASIANRMASEKLQSSVESYSAGFSKVFESRDFKDQIDSSSKNFEEQKLTTEEKALSNIEKATEAFVQRHNITKESVAGLAMSLSSTFGEGFSKMLPSEIRSIMPKLEIKGDTGMRAVSTDEIQDMQELLKSKELQESLRIAKTMSESNSISLRDDKGNSLSDSVRSDWSQAENYSNTAQKSFSEAQEFSKRAEKSEASGYSVNEDLTNSLIDYVRQNYGADKTKDNGFMLQVSRSEEFIENYHYQSALSKIHQDNSLPRDLNSVKDLNFDDIAHLGSKTNNSFNHFKGQVFDHSSINRRGDIDNSDLSNQIPSAINQNSDRINNTRIANSKFEEDIKELANDHSALGKLLTPGLRTNRTHTNIFEEEDKND